MAGYYYYDPSFYSPAEYKLISLDELFNPSRRDPKLDGEKKEVKAKDGKKKENEEKNKTVEIKVYLCCDKCVEDVKNVLNDMEGVEAVDCCQYTGKVTVKGDMKPEHVLKRVRKVKSNAELWPKKKQN